MEHLEKNVLDYATVRACLLRDGTADRQIIFQRPSLLFPPVEKTARLHPMVGHPPPPRDHPDEDVWQRVLRVFAQSAETVKEALGPAIFLTDSGSSYPRPGVKCKDKRLRHLFSTSRRAPDPQWTRARAGSERVSPCPALSCQSYLDL